MRIMAKTAAQTRNVSKAPLSLKVTLRDTKPPVWRRLLIPGEMTLGDLHQAIQTAMGWDGGHLHAFDIAGRQYGDPDSLDEVADEERLTLNLSEPTRLLAAPSFPAGSTRRPPADPTGASRRELNLHHAPNPKRGPCPKARAMSVLRGPPSRLAQLFSIAPSLRAPLGWPGRSRPSRTRLMLHVPERSIGRSRRFSWLVGPAQAVGRMPVG